MKNQPYASTHKFFPLIHSDTNIYIQEINKPDLNIDVNNKSTKKWTTAKTTLVVKSNNNTDSVITEMWMLAIVSSVFLTVKTISFVHIWIKLQWVQLSP